MMIEAVQRLLRERREPPANPPQKVPELAGPGWRVIPWDNDGVWLHIPPDNPVTDDEKEAPSGSSKHD